MNCGTDDERSDFFAFNDYSWCDPSSFKKSGWDQKVEKFTGYGIPLFLSEYGCNKKERKFEEVESLYSTDMTGVYSGGLVYEYSQETSKYGLVSIAKDNVKQLPDFDALKTAFSKTENPKGDGEFNKTGGANACPKKSSPDWDVDSDSLPAMPAPAKKYLTEGAGKAKGFSGGGSMDAGTESTATASPGSGKVTGSTDGPSTTPSKGAATGLRPPPMSMAPVAVGLVTILSTLLGASVVLL